MATTDYVNKISNNKIMDSEAREEIKRLQRQVQALRICILAIVRGLTEVNKGTLINTTPSPFEKDIARSAYQLAAPGKSHINGNLTTLSSLNELFYRGVYYFSENGYNGKGLDELIGNYYSSFSRSTDDASGTINTLTEDSNIF